MTTPILHRLSPWILVHLLLAIAIPSPVRAQNTGVMETVRIEVYTPAGFLVMIDPGKVFQCPSDVSVGSAPVTIRSTVSTTSENPVSFMAQFAFTNTTLSAATTSNRGPFTSSSNGATTTLQLNTTVKNGSPVMYEITTEAIAVGPAGYHYQTFIGGSPSRNDLCEFNVVAPMHTLSVESQPPGVPIGIEVDGESDGTVMTPFSRTFPENAEVAFTAPDEFNGVPFTQWQNSIVSTNPRFEVTVTTDETITAFYGEPVVADLGIQLVEVQNGFLMDNLVYLPPGETSILLFEATNAGPDATGIQAAGSLNPSLVQIQEVSFDGGTCGGSGPSFSCTALLEPETSAILSVTVHTLVEGSTSAGVFVSTQPPADDPNDENNGISFGLVVIEPGIIEGRKRVRLGDDLFGPLDGFEIQLADSQGELLSAVMTSAGGFFQFIVPPGEYFIREESAPHLSPISPPGGEMLTNVTGGQIVVVNFDNNADQGIDWGDLPDPRPPSDMLDPTCIQRGGNNSCYPTRAPQGAAHPIRQGLHLGASVDAENNGQPDATAEGDDLDGNDDEDGVTFASLPPGGMGRVEAVVSLPTDLDEAFLSAFIDFNDNGLFDALPELIIDTILVAGAHTLDFSVPENATLNFARFRLSSRADAFGLANPPYLLPDGLEFDGEVEDYFALTGIDYGDAPSAVDPSRPEIPGGYPTELFDGGARHLASTTIRLGDAIDSDRDGLPTTTADGDDQDNLYDEDGIRFLEGFLPISVRPEPKAPGGTEIRYGIAQGTDGTILPLASIDGKLDAWIDFNRDGDWGDAGEQIFDSEDVQTGPDYTPLTFTVPETAEAGFTFARFRFSRNGNLDFDGPASDGEVEDYLLQILERNPITTTADDGPGSLRQAFLDAIATGRFTLIDLRGLNKQATISLRSPLPSLTVPVVIHGGGIVLDGADAGGDADGMVFTADGSVVTGLTIQGFSRHGLLIESDANLIEQTILTDNGGDGARLLGRSNVLFQGTFLNNDGLGIDLGGDGPTPNDTEDIDGRQNAPVITTVSITDSTRIEGLLTSTPATSFVLQFYENDACDGSGFGEGNAFVGAATVTTGPNGQVNFAVALGSLLTPGRTITATATGPDGTSEFSQCQVSTETARVADLPAALRLHTNYPNPFYGATTLRFDLPEAAVVHIEVLDMLGRRVLVLPARRVGAGPERTFPLDASSLPAGLYLYRLTAEGATETWTATGRMIRVR